MMKPVVTITTSPMLRAQDARTLPEYPGGACGPALDRVLTRIGNARKIGDRWSSRCPAHDDSSPSLSIRGGPDGVLLHCFAGCAVSAVVAVLGLRMADLFDKPLHPQVLVPQPQRTPTADEIEASLRANLRSILDEEAKRLGYEPPITSRHHNRARQTVSRLFGVTIPLAAAAWSECSPHDTDPLWPIFAKYALEEIATWERGHDAPTQEDRNDALDRAAEWLRYEARRTLMLEKAGNAA